MRSGRQKEPERARRWGRERTVNHCSIKSQEVSAQGKKKSPGEPSAAAGSISFSFCV